MFEFILKIQNKIVFSKYNSNLDNTGKQLCETIILYV